MSDVYNIEKGFPIPDPRRSWTKYKFREMEIGDSFLVPCSRFDLAKTMNSLTSCRAHWQRKLGWKFLMRTRLNGIRIWRVK